MIRGRLSIRPQLPVTPTRARRWRQVRSGGVWHKNLRCSHLATPRSIEIGRVELDDRDWEQYSCTTLMATS
jgi:hypothetical protein